VLYTIDIGTSSFKSAIWDFEGNRIAFSSIPLSISLNDGLRHETDSAQWLRAFEDSCRRLGAEVPLTAVEAVVISGNGPSLTPVFESGGGDLCVPAAPARLWLDRRAAKAAEQVSALAGGFVDAGFYLPKALDIKTNEPQLYERTKYFLGCPELLAFALTGEARTVFPSDGFERWFWTDSLLDRLGLDREKFPRFIRPGETFGGLTPQCAARFGLKPDIPVISGGPDFFAAILGSGVIQPGQVCDRAGTSEGINACTKTRITDERLMSYSHPVKPFFNLSGIVSTTGKAIEWARDLLGVPTPDDFCALAQTAQAGAGGLVFVPYLAGERAPIWNPFARATLRGLTLSTRPAEFARAVLEGICFAIRDVISIMEESGAVIDELRIAGAMSGNAILNQIKADITQKRVLVTQHKEAELLGLAIIGSCALGKFASFAEAAAGLVRIEKTFQPDGKTAALYDGLFGEYRRMREMG
jgi:xylulokinase